MKNILYAFKDFDDTGGAEKNLIEVAEHATKSNNTYFIIASGNKTQRLSSIGKLLFFPSRGVKPLFFLDMFYLLYISSRYNIDILHSHHRYPSFIASIIKPITRFKLLTTVHNVFPDKEGFSNWGDHAIAVSNSVYKWVTSGNKYKESDVSVIYNGITIPNLHSDEELSSLKNELDYESDLIYLCSVGRLSEQKNYSLLFTLLSELKINNWHLLLVGSGEEKENLIILATELKINNNITFMGQRSDIDLIMQLSDVFLLTSRWEGFPYVVIEALSNGLPVFSTNVGGIHEAIINGETGFLFELKDSKKYIETLEMIMKDKALRSTMSSNCKKVFLENFTIDKMHEKTEHIYQHL